MTGRLTKSASLPVCIDESKVKELFENFKKNMIDNGKNLDSSVMRYAMGKLTETNKDS